MKYDGYKVEWQFFRTGNLIRFIAALLSIVPMIADAAEIDCETLKSTTQPFEISWTFGKYESVLQIYREKSGDAVRWRQVTTPGFVNVSKIEFFDGVGSEFTRTYRGGQPLKGKSTFSGLPKGFNHRSDLTYAIDASNKFPDGQTVKSTTTVHFHFVSETRKAIGGCVFAIIKSEETLTVDGKANGPTTVYFLPDLQTPSLLADDDTEFHISTSFTPLRLLN